MAVGLFLVFLTQWCVLGAVHLLGGSAPLSLTAVERISSPLMGTSGLSSYSAFLGTWVPVSLR